MKALRTCVAAAIVVALVFAVSGVAYAAPANDYGYVYGQVNQVPVVAITLGGDGASELDPLYYVGHGGDAAWENWGAWVSVYNDGECDVNLYISANESPNDGLGDWWDFGNSSDVDQAVWEFDDTSDSSMVAVPFSGANLLGFLGVDDTAYLDSRFTFPSNFTSENTYHMSAMITAYED
jgi:hypothetical protein